MDNDASRFHAEVMQELEEAMETPEYKSFDLMFNAIFGDEDVGSEEDGA